MAYTVLARKYRSQTFGDVVGQDPIAKTLRNAIETGRVAHAYLFSGTRGVGKTTMARILAKALNCLESDGPTTTPCLKCESCKAINLGEDIDVIEIDGASNNRVDEIRELRENAIYRPARSRFKIYIIDEVHMLTTGAFNALLKTLEEPPSHVKFIFATTEPNKVLATIQSRCQRFDFSNIGAALIAKQLECILRQEGIKYEDDVILPLAKMANGSMRDGLSLLDRLISTGAEPLTARLLEEFLGCPNSEKIWNLIGCIGEGDAAGTLAALDALLSTGTTEVQVLDSLIEYMRDVMVVKSAGADSELLILTAEQRKRTSELAERFDIAALVYSIATLEKLRWSVKNSETSRALLEASLLRFALSEHFLNIDRLLLQVEGGSTASVKKKRPLKDAPADKPAAPAQRLCEPQPEEPFPARCTDIQSIKDKWQDILEAIASNLGMGTAGLLNAAVPTRFENGVLTLRFGSSAKIQKEMCERNGRAEQIQALLGRQLSTPVRLNLEIAAAEQTGPEAPQKHTRLSAQMRNEIINDPAVKTVITELNATITGIEED